MEKTDVAYPEQIDIVYALQADILGQIESGLDFIAHFSGVPRRAKEVASATLRTVTSFKAYSEKKRGDSHRQYRALKQLGYLDAVNALVAQFAEEDAVVAE